MTVSTTDTWEASSGNWDDAGDWSSGVPTASSTVAVNASDFVDYTGTPANATVAEADLTGGGIWVDSGSLTIGILDETIGYVSTTEYDAFFAVDGATATIGTIEGNDANVNVEATSTQDATATINDVAKGTVLNLKVIGETGAGAKTATVKLTNYGSTLSDSWYLSDNADIVLSSALTSIAATTGSLEIIDNAQLTLKAGGSALSGLKTNYGAFDIETDIASSPASVKTKSGFTNEAAGVMYVDTASGNGGSTVKFGGTLTNDGQLLIGDQSNTGDIAATNVSASGLVNSGTIDLYDGTNDTYWAYLTIKGAASNSGTVDIGADSELDMTGKTYTQTAGTTTVAGTLIASNVTVNGGSVDFESAVTKAEGLGTFDIGAAGTLEFDATVDSSHTVDFTAKGGTLDLGEDSSFSGKIKGFAADDTIELLDASITNLAFNSKTDMLTVTDSLGTVSLHFSGTYKAADFSYSDTASGGKITYV